MTVPSPRGRGEGAAALAGGVLVALGAWLPWLSLFAGLLPRSGLAGVYGRSLLAAGILLAVAGVGMLTRYGGDRLRTAAGAAALLVFAFDVWLIFSMHDLVGGLAARPMLAARPGPGLYVIAAGAALAAGPALTRGLSPLMARS